jgi:hypothetical protein
MLSRALCFCVLLSVGATAAAYADPGLVPPDGWTHVDNAGTPDPARTFDTWKQSSSPGSQTITVIRDTSSTYADAVGRVKKNFADNNIHASVDADGTCQGQTSHTFEFAAGPDGHQFVVNRTVVAIPNGVMTVTYVRSETQVFNESVKTSLDTFCGVKPAAAAGAPAASASKP